MRIKRQTRSYFCEKIFTRKMVILGLGPEKKWCSIHDSKPQREWDRLAELMMIKISESGHPVFRSTSPLSRGTLKSQGGGQLSIHFCADEGTIETVVRTIILFISSVFKEQSQICVKNTNPAMVGQSDPLFEPASLLTKTPAPSTDDPAQEDPLQEYQERVERLSQQKNMIKFCTDAGFLTTVEVGQYFMTKDTE